VTLSVTTTAATAKLAPPRSHRGGIFYAALLPGLLGIFFCAGVAKSAGSPARKLGLIAFLCISTLWLGACGNSSSSSNKNPGTTKGAYTITVNATTGGTNAVKGSTTVKLQVN
jgi:hypothetical protein